MYTLIGQKFAQSSTRNATVGTPLVRAGAAKQGTATAGTARGNQGLKQFLAALMIALSTSPV